MRSPLRLVPLLAALVACDDTTFLSGGDTPAGQDFCAVKGIFEADCVACHGVDGSGGLDLATDPYTALVNVQSSEYAGRTLVVPGDPEASFLYLKVSGGQGADGGAMPPGGALSAAAQEAIAAWIRDGASATCEGDTGGGGGGHHPDLWWMPENHGLAAKLQEEQCVSCHGEDLTGGSVGVGCDTCHTEGWRQDCTFCHGGEDNTTGAPPRDIDGSPSNLAFSPHTAHVTQGISVARDCDTCHKKPEHVLSPGHIFIGDTTPAVAEVDLSGGLSSPGKWTSGSCSNLYCHGDGQGDDGSVSASDGPRDCGSCHADAGSGGTAWGQMSGQHRLHMSVGATCSTCHPQTTNSAQSILDPSLHVDGTAQVQLPTGMTRTAYGCTGTCHIGGESRLHESEDRW